MGNKASMVRELAEIAREDAQTIGRRPVISRSSTWSTSIYEKVSYNDGPLDTVSEAHLVSFTDEASSEMSLSRSSPSHSDEQKTNDEADLECMKQFLGDFTRRHGQRLPEFFKGTLRSAVEHVTDAHGLFAKPILIYLHHDGSDIADIFAQEVLCSETFADCTRSSYLIWGWNMTSGANRQAFSRMAQPYIDQDTITRILTYGLDNYPIMLVLMKTDKNIQISQVLEGYRTIEEIVVILVTAQQVFDLSRDPTPEPCSEASNAPTSRESILDDMPPPPSYEDLNPSICGVGNTQNSQQSAVVVPCILDMDDSSGPSTTALLAMSKSTFQDLHEEFKPLISNTSSPVLQQSDAFGFSRSEINSGMLSLECASTPLFPSATLAAEQSGHAPEQSGHVPEQSGHVPEQSGHVSEQSGHLSHVVCATEELHESVPVLEEINVAPSENVVECAGETASASAVVFAKGHIAEGCQIESHADALDPSAHESTDSCFQTAVEDEREWPTACCHPPECRAESPASSPVAVDAECKLEPAVARVSVIDQ